MALPLPQLQGAELQLCSPVLCIIPTTTTTVSSGCPWMGQTLQLARQLPQEHLFSSLFRFVGQYGGDRGWSQGVGSMCTPLKDTLLSVLSPGVII